MQVELEELQPKLVVASEENDKMMKVCYFALTMHVNIYFSKLD